MVSLRATTNQFRFRPGFQLTNSKSPIIPQATVSDETGAVVHADHLSVESDPVVAAAVDEVAATVDHESAELVALAVLAEPDPVNHAVEVVQKEIACIEPVVARPDSELVGLESGLVLVELVHVPVELGLVGFVLDVPAVPVPLVDGSAAPGFEIVVLVDWREQDCLLDG